MTRMICLRASSDCKRLTKHENTGLGWVIAASRSVCDTPINERLGKLAPMRLAVEQLVLLLVWISLVMRRLFVDFFDLFQARQP